MSQRAKTIAKLFIINIERYNMRHNDDISFIHMKGDKLNMLVGMCKVQEKYLNEISHQLQLNGWNFGWNRSKDYFAFKNTLLSNTHDAFITTKLGIKGIKDLIDELHSNWKNGSKLISQEFSKFKNSNISLYRR